MKEGKNILYDGSEVTLYPQGPGFVVWNIIGTIDEYPDLCRFLSRGTTPLCTVMNGCCDNASRETNYSDYPQIVYGLTTDGRLFGEMKQSPTLMPCFTGDDKEDYGRLYWNENIFQGNGGFKE